MATSNHTRISTSLTDVIAFSPDGRTVATGSADKTARVWEVATGKEITRLEGHNLSVWSVAFSPDGDAVVTGDGEGLVFLWQLCLSVAAVGGEGDAAMAGGSGFLRRLQPGWPHTRHEFVAYEAGTALGRGGEKEHNRPQRHVGAVTSSAFSPDGRLLVTGSMDTTVRLWDVASGKEINALRGYRAAVFSVAFSPDGRTVVSGSQDGTARLWEVSPGKSITTVRSIKREIELYRFRPSLTGVRFGSALRAPDGCAQQAAAMAWSC